MAVFVNFIQSGLNMSVLTSFFFDWSVFCNVKIRVHIYFDTLYGLK